MNDPIVTIRETDFGNLYTILRDVKKSDFEIVNSFPDELSVDDYTEDSYIYSAFDVALKGRITEDSLIDFKEKSKWRKKLRAPGATMITKNAACFATSSTRNTGTIPGFWLKASGSSPFCPLRPASLSRSGFCPGRTRRFSMKSRRAGFRTLRLS